MTNRPRSQAPRLVEKRQHFRIEYPVLMRPTLSFWDQYFPVLDLCEHAARFDLGGVDGIEEGAVLPGILDLRGYARFSVPGHVLRRTRGYAVFYFEIPIPQRVIYDEQRVLLHNRTTG